MSRECQDVFGTSDPVQELLEMASSSTWTLAAVNMAEQIKLFNCPICKNFMYPPIYQCPNGHVLCSNCKKNREKNRCSTCKKEIGYNIRALIMEKIGDTIQFPCKYRVRGCLELCKYDKKREHEEDGCSRRPYKCPFSLKRPCNLTGDVEALVLHLVNDHGCIVKETNKIDFYLSPVVVDRPVVYKYNSEYFILRMYVGELCVLSNDDEPLISSSRVINLSFMGGEMDAMKFRYKLKISKEKYKASWKATPSGIRRGHIQEGLCIQRGLINGKLEGWILPAR